MVFTLVAFRMLFQLEGFPQSILCCLLNSFNPVDFNKYTRKHTRLDTAYQTETAKVAILVIKFMASSDLSTRYLRLRGIMTGRHFQANMKVQTAMCKDNKSKSRAATYVKFDTHTHTHTHTLLPRTSIPP